MKQSFTLLGIGLSFSALLPAIGAHGQESAPQPTPIIEIFPCTYRGDSDANDLRQLTARFNTWADRNNVTSYTAFVATPYAFSADLGADVLWIGGWPNGTQMGTNETLWQAQGGEVSAAFDALVECNSHSLYAEVIVNQPSGPPPENGVAMFEDCTVHEGRTDAEAIEAARQWAAYTKSRGSDDISAILFPLAGLTSDDDYSFKVVTGFASMEAFGRGTDMYTGGGFLRARELFGRLLDCNSPRIYMLERVRLASMPPSG